MRSIDFCITQFKAQGPARTCNESKEEDEKGSNDAPELLSRSTALIDLEPWRRDRSSFRVVSFELRIEKFSFRMDVPAISINV